MEETNNIVYQEDNEEVDTYKQKKRVLIVDDDIVLPTILITMISESKDPIISQYDYQFKVSRNAEEGEKAIEEYDPDLVLSDLIMAEGNGTPVIKKSKEKNKPVILMVTDYPKDELDQQITPNYILKKPFKTSDLELAVKTVLD